MRGGLRNALKPVENQPEPPHSACAARPQQAAARYLDNASPS